MNLKGSKTEDNLKVAFAGETHEYTDMYPGMAKTAPGRGLRGDRRLVRDPGQGGALPRQPLPEGPGRARRLIAEINAVDKKGRRGAPFLSQNPSVEAMRPTRKSLAT
jgi:rubrerythrin